MKIRRQTQIVVGTIAALILTAEVAQSEPNIIFVSRAQLRRTVDSSSRSAYGTVEMTIDDRGRETIRFDVHGLGELDFRPVARAESTPSTNAVPTAYLPPLNLIDSKRGIWTRKVVETGQAPGEMIYLVDHLTDFGTNHIVEIAQPDVPRVTTIFTNIIAGVTNISMGVTNITGNITNIINGIVIPNPGQTGSSFATLWAPLHPVVPDPSLLSFRSRGRFLPPEGSEASPKARATVNVSYNGATGRSILDIRASNLTRGQTYTLWIANGTNAPIVLLAAAEMTSNKSGSQLRFIRDTQYGDPLPQQVRDVSDLSQRLFQIRDGFKVVHIEGYLP